MKKGSAQITKNKKAFFDYEIVESWEAGILLKGYETKSVRQGHVNLKGAFIVVVSGELFIKGMHITPWKALANRESLLTDGPSKVFLHRKTIDYLTAKVKEGGNTLIPTELYFKGSLVKLRVALARGKKAYQKKQVLKERAMDKQAKLAMKKYI
ncbi:MAG: SsrA-binding protein SmpB [Candidatus Gracilibacteria bacterium]|nr:SsrA-binding protein SmpB [Candidatus Gracilibacteria bacterium]